MHDIKLGVPQCSVFVPPLFLIFFNDLAFVLEVTTKLFADDKTLYDTTKKTNDSLTDLISVFR